VHCSKCPVDRFADFPDRAGAEELVERHHKLRGHVASITRVLDTPLEGLLE